jgi:diguanylate cyclase (GGDEF)-like protein
MREKRVVSRTKARVNGQTNGHAREVVGMDDLTGVWNRAGFVAAANPMYISCQRRESPIALAYFDFDSSEASRSPEQNATIDRVLMAMATQLRKAFRASDVVGRVDTFRFGVLLTDCTDEALAAVDGVRALSDELSALSGLTLTAGMVRSAPTTSLDDLMLAADQKLKELKSA